MTANDNAVSPLKRTPLYDRHRASGARLVEFGGWEMPVQYSSISEEHRAVRAKAGLFDVSHMGEFKADGPAALEFLQYLVPNDVSRLAINQALYTQLCLHAGNVIDDLLIYHLAKNQYMLVVNAGNIEKDFTWVKTQAESFDVRVENQSEQTSLLALQGPLAGEILQPLTETKLADIRYYHFAQGVVAGVHCLISRTGYTGEDGFELYCSPDDVVKLWDDLLAAGQPAGLLPAGLGARDTLRLESGFCLYEHELDEKTNPLEARLGWTVKLDKGDFIGRAALVKAKEQGLQKKLIGVELLDRGVARAGYAIYADDQPIGYVTSGAPGLTVNKSIAMGYVDVPHAVVDQPIQIDIRGRRLAARVVALPFYKRT